VVKRQLLVSSVGVGWRSVRLSERVLTCILETLDVYDCRVPVGITVEDITQSNFELSAELLERLGRIYFAFQKEVAVGRQSVP